MTRTIFQIITQMKSGASLVTTDYTDLRGTHVLISADGSVHSRVAETVLSEMLSYDLIKVSPEKGEFTRCYVLA